MFVTKKSHLIFLTITVVLDLINQLLAHKKFANVFVDRGGVQQLIQLPRSIYLSGGIALCLYGLASVTPVLEKLMQLPDPIPAQIVQCGMWILGLPADNPRISACYFFSCAITCRAGMYMFDVLDGGEDMNSALQAEAAAHEEKRQERARLSRTETDGVDEEISTKETGHTIATKNEVPMNREKGKERIKDVEETTPGEQIKSDHGFSTSMKASKKCRPDIRDKDRNEDDEEERRSIGRRKRRKLNPEADSISKGAEIQRIREELLTGEAKGNGLRMLLNILRTCLVRMPNSDSLLPPSLQDTPRKLIISLVHVVCLCIRQYFRTHFVTKVNLIKLGLHSHAHSPTTSSSNTTPSKHHSQNRSGNQYTNSDDAEEDMKIAPNYRVLDMDNEVVDDAISFIFEKNNNNHLRNDRPKTEQQLQVQRQRHQQELKKAGLPVFYLDVRRWPFISLFGDLAGFDILLELTYLSTHEWGYPDIAQFALETLQVAAVVRVPKKRPLFL